MSVESPETWPDELEDAGPSEAEDGDASRWQFDPFAVATTRNGAEPEPPHQLVDALTFIAEEGDAEIAPVWGEPA